MAPVVKVSFQIFNVDASVSFKSVVLENRDTGLVMCESLDNMTVLKLRATCKAGRTIANEVFCPVKAYKRVGFWLGYGSEPRVLAKLVEEGELRLLQHAHQIAHDSGRWGGSRVVWGRDVLIAAATSGRIDILDWMHNHAEPKIKMDHKPTGLGLSTTAAARAGHLETLKWMRKQQPPFAWNGTLYSEASRCGHLHVLEWAYAQTPRCPIKGSELDPEYHDAIGIVWHLDCHRRQTDRMRLCSHHQHEMKARDEEYARIVAAAQPVLDWIRPLLPARRLAQLDRLDSDAPMVAWTDKGFVNIA